MSNADDETRFPDASAASAASSSLVAGRYRIGTLLGRGGSGQVHQALDELTGDAVAVKFVRALGAGQRAQLRRELTALRLLDLPGVVRLLDEGEDEEHTFLVMQLLPGGPFDVLTNRGGWSTWRDEALAMLEALARVHLAGVIHRDLKPDRNGVASYPRSRTGVPVAKDAALRANAWSNVINSSMWSPSRAT